MSCPEPAWPRFAHATATSLGLPLDGRRAGDSPRPFLGLPFPALLSPLGCMSELAMVSRRRGRFSLTQSPVGCLESPGSSPRRAWGLRKKRPSSAGPSMCCRKVEQAIALVQILTGSRLPVLSATGRVEARLQAIDLLLADEGRWGLSSSHAPRVMPLPRLSRHRPCTVLSTGGGNLYTVWACNMRRQAAALGWACRGTSAQWDSLASQGVLCILLCGTLPRHSQSPTWDWEKPAPAHGREKRHPGRLAGAEQRWGVVP
jgi:hypothetical protein